MELAKLIAAPKTLSPSHHTKMSAELLISNLLVTIDPYQLPLMPTTGLSIPVESSPTVDLLSITEFYSPDILLLIG